MFARACLVLCFIVTGGLACECGLSSVGNRIYNGKKFEEHKYPWLTYVEVKMESAKGTYTKNCGGAILDKFSILTAAHCLYQLDFDFHTRYVKVTVGAHKKISSGKTYPIVAVKLDGRFDHIRDDTHYDIAILKLGEQLKFSSKVSPICVPSDPVIPVFQRLFLAGWGRTNKNTETMIPYEAQLQSLTRKECFDRKVEFYAKKRFGYVDALHENHLCAQNKTHLSDACAGDSGSPLMYKNKKSRYYVVGLVSGGWVECAEDNIPSLYTAVQKYIKFIQKYAGDTCFKAFNE